MNENDLSKEQKIAILEKEIDLQLTNRYVLTIRNRVATQVKNKENQAVCQKGLEDIEMALDILSAEMEALKKAE
jgi:hypothetical protein